MTTTAMTRAKATAAGLAFATLLGCSNATAPEPTAYDLMIEMRKIHVTGDCEDTPGNPGEFAYRMTAQLATTGASSTHETNLFPDGSGALPYSEDDTPIVLAGTDVRLFDIPLEDIERVFLTFGAIEFDPGGRDPDMNFEQVAVPVLFRIVNPPVGLVTVGGSSACRLTLEFQPFWTPASP